jgi:1-acyl-sn-glycerol-3-phosphate acyltransferase
MTMAAAERTTAGDVLRSIVFYFAFYGFSLLLAFVVSLQVLLPGRGFVDSIYFWTRWHRWCARHILGIKVVIEGQPPTGPVLVAVKHESFFEAIDLPVLLDYPAVFAKIELIRLPLWGKAGQHYGLIGVERDQGAKALRTMLAEAKMRLAEGRPLAIFPEGTRIPHGTRGPLQAGFAGIYKLLRLPVVPIAVNSGPLYQRRWKKPGVITIKVGEQIPAGLDRDAIEARVTAAINALNTDAPQSALHDPVAP